MTSINISRGAGALFIIGIVWIPIGYLVSGMAGAVVAGIVASIAVVIGALTDSREAQNRRRRQRAKARALTAEDLESEKE